MTRLFSAFASALCVLLVGGVGPSVAGGFGYSGGTSAYGSGHSTTNVYVKSKYAKYKSTTYANATVKVLHGGKIAIGTANTGNYTNFSAYGNSQYKQWKKAKAKVYAKGGNIMAKARSENYVTINAAGKTYVVAKEVARAMARFTPLGTTAAADSLTYLNASSSGYLGVHTGSKSSATVRVKR